jgi:hypothetical protein
MKSQGLARKDLVSFSDSIQGKGIGNNDKTIQYTNNIKLFNARSLLVIDGLVKSRNSKFW